MALNVLPTLYFVLCTISQKLRSNQFIAIQHSVSYVLCTLHSVFCTLQVGSMHQTESTRYSYSVQSNLSPDLLFPIEIDRGIFICYLIWLYFIYLLPIWSNCARDRIDEEMNE